MSVGKSSVDLKNINYSETIVTLRSLLKEDTDLSDDRHDEEEGEKSLSSPEFLNDGNNITLLTNSRPATVCITGYIAKDLPKRFGAAALFFSW